MLRNMNSTGTRTQEHANNCSHNVLLACPTNGRFEYESPLRFHLLEEPTWNLFLQTIIFIISGCFVFAWNRCGHNRIAKGQDIGIFLRVFCHRLDNHDADQEIAALSGTEDRIRFVRKQIKAVRYFFQSFNTRKQQCGKDGAILMSCMDHFCWVMAFVLLLVTTDTRGQVNLTIVLLLPFIIFIVSIVSFYLHITKNALRARCSGKTLLVKINRHAIYDKSNLMGMLWASFPTATAINSIRRVDKLEALEEQLQIAKETKKLLQDNAKTRKVRDDLSHYDKIITNLNHSIIEEVRKRDKAFHNSVFITFKTHNDAKNAKDWMLRLDTKDWTLDGELIDEVEWAPPSQDIQWEKLYEYEAPWYRPTFLWNFSLYVLRALLTIVGCSAIVLFCKTFFTYDKIVLDQLRPLLTWFCMSISLIFGMLHTRKTNVQSGMFWTTLVDFIVTEIILPSFSLMDPHELWLWLTTSQCKITRILVCTFRQDLGKALCILIIQWTFLQSVMLII